MKKVLHLSKDELKNKIKSLIQEQEETESGDFSTLISQLLFSQQLLIWNGLSSLKQEVMLPAKNDTDNNSHLQIFWLPLWPSFSS